MLRRLVIVLSLMLPAASAHADCSNIDGQSTNCDLGVTIASVSDLNTRRANLINMAWNVNTGVLPNTMPTVTRGVTDPFAGTSWATPASGWNVASVDQFMVNLASPFPSTDSVNPIYLWRAKPPIAGGPDKNRLVIFNGGHQDTCDWTAMATHYTMQVNLRRLLAAGYSVLGMNQPGPNPNCGNGAANAMSIVHIQLGPIMGSRIVYPFLEPNNQILNWLENPVNNSQFDDYNMTGISGGGYETDMYAAIDPRIHISIGAASGIPGLQFITGGKAGPNYVEDGAGGCIGDACWAEAQDAPYYTIAGYMDQYVMAGYGTTTNAKKPGAPRLHQHLLNVYDACCWGDGQWSHNFGTVVGGNYMTYFSKPNPGAAQCGNVDSCDWTKYLAYYSQEVANKVAALGGPGQGQSLPTMIDWVSNYHQISNCDADSFTSPGIGGPGNDAGTPQDPTFRCKNAANPNGGAKTVGGYPDGISYIIATLNANPPVAPPPPSGTGSGRTRRH